MITSFVINSINGGVNVTFSHGEECVCGQPNPHTVTINAPDLPIDNVVDMQNYLKNWATAYNAGKLLELHDSSAVQSLVNQTISLE